MPNGISDHDAMQIKIEIKTLMFQAQDIGN